MAKLSLHCACGGSLVGAVRPDHLAARLGEAWTRSHDAEQCAPATPAQAAAARRRADRST